MTALPASNSQTEGLDHAGLHRFHANVKAYGAAGDGVQDDAAYIQAAIDAVAAQEISGKSRGGVVYFPPGEYVISTMLSIDADSGSTFGSIGFQGAGWYASTIKWKTGVSAPTAMVRITGGQNSGAKFEGLQFDGNDIASRGIYGTDTILMTFSRLSFDNFAVGSGNDACIYMDQSSSGCLLNTIEMCWFGQGGICDNKGIYFANGHGNWIIRNEFGGTANGSVYLTGGDANYIVMNDFEGLTTNGTYSIQLGPNRGTVIRDNRFEDLGFSPNTTARSIFCAAGGIDISGNDFGEAGGGTYQIEFSGVLQEVHIHSNYYTNSSSTANIKIPADCDNIHIYDEGNTGATHVEDNSVAGLGGTGLQWGANGYTRGFKNLTINKQTPGTVTPDAHLDVNGQAFTNGVSTTVVAGAVTDGAFTYVEDGMLGVDSTNGRLYLRYGGAWHYIDVTA